MVSPVRIRVPPLLNYLQNIAKTDSVRERRESSGNSRLRERPRYGLHGGVLHFVRGVRVDGEGHPDVGVAQHSLGGRGVDVSRGERGGEGVPETVEDEPFAREARPLQERAELAAVEVARV